MFRIITCDCVIMNFFWRSDSTNMTIQLRSPYCYGCSLLLRFKHLSLPISVAERSKARVNDRSLAGIAGSNSAGGVDTKCLSKRKLQMVP